ncbi:MAG: tRNA (N6-isopentenyl adenosine(37)-C2)-methylthiotransferase MiaB, partial [Gemmatimonadetes bacterium]|nr:tRNA (N6-isopentenyl adenosine(37)-C2)-methylthiotransferase MiaB [Gemmatimonadota bacterium]
MSELPRIELLETAEATPQAAASRPAPDHHRSVYIETYGCQMNVADTEVVASILADAGYRIVDQLEAANVILVNTCAIRENAEERVIGRVSQLNGLRNQRPDLTIGVLGCMAQHLTDTLPARAPYVDLIAGPDTYQRLPELLAETADETLLDTRLSRTENYVGIDPTRSKGTNAWVTIIRGCDKFCTFCVV